MFRDKLSRRQFLQTTATTAAAASLLPSLPALGESGKSQTKAYPENGTLIPDDGWHLWIDEQAEWKDDAIFSSGRCSHRQTAYQCSDRRMGNWYFVRKHPIYDGLPVDQVMGIHYQVKGRQSNGLLVDGPGVEIVAAYSRDHDRNIGAGTFTTRLGATKVLYHRVPELHPVLQQRLLANALDWLTA